MPFQVGQRVGDYEVIQLLGAGGMGHVYKVRNIISNRAEAMKVLLPDLTAEPDLAMRFISEIRTLAGFDHPNIAQLHTALQADNQLIMMMEFVEGYTLEQIARQRSMPPAEVAGYVSQALGALGYAHERGVIHRDIKPANLMVTSHGIVKLMDFGIAKSNAENNNQTKPGTTMGSLYYMSPEQVRGSGVDPRSDIYSVGIMLYELLAGRRPFEADTTFSILNQQLNVPPQPPIEVNPSLAPQLNQIILRALEKDPAQRFQSAEEFRTALKPFVSAPSGQEVMQPIAQPAPAPAPAYQQQQQPAYEQQPAYHQQPQYGNPYPAAMPPPSSGGGKGLWIATGAIAVILALVGIGFAVPHFLHNNKASASASTGDTSTPSATVNTTPATVATTPSNDTNTIPPSTTTPSTTTSPATNGSAMTGPSANGAAMMAHNPNAGGATHVGGKQQQLQTSAQGQGYTPQMAPPPSNGPSPADTHALDDAEERMGQVRARANTAKRAVNQIRVQQEQQGLGMRGDIESAESRMDSYLQAASNDIQRGNAAKAASDLDKADTELGTLEKFLGH